MEHVVVLDNGGNTIKVGFADERNLKMFPNCAVRPKRERRLYIGDQLDQIIDYSNLFYRRPITKGYVTKWDLQSQIWSRAFGKQILNADPSRCSLLVTEPPFNPKVLQRTMNEVVFEEFGFQSFYRAPTAQLAIDGCRHQNNNSAMFPVCALVIDAGFSFTHITPVYDGNPINFATKRLNIGGKMLTNYLKEIVSYRAWNMMEESYLLEDIKKALCFVSTDFQGDLKKSAETRSPLASYYVLPTSNTHVGHVKLPTDDDVEYTRADQMLKLNNERFCVPELLFRPSDIGMESGGLAEAVVEAVSKTHPSLHGLFYSNIMLIGGTTLLPKLQDRLELELRPLIPSDFNISIHRAPKPVKVAWDGGAVLGRSEEFHRMAVSKAKYEEEGHAICERKFFSY